MQMEMNIKPKVGHKGGEGGVGWCRQLLLLLSDLPVGFS